MIVLPQNSSITPPNPEENDILLPGTASGFKLDAYHSISYQRYASIGITSGENEVRSYFTFKLAIPVLRLGIAATVKACAAWAVLLASHGCAAKRYMVASGTEELIGTLDLSIRWNSCVGDLVYQVQAKLA